MGALFATGDPLETLELLTELGVTVTLDQQTGQLRARPRPVPALARELIAANRALVHAVLLGAEGRRYGYKDPAGKARSKTLRHVWMRCDECNEGVMREKSAGAKKCVITPNCEGKHQP
jgi:hypothetical protein